MIEFRHVSFRYRQGDEGAGLRGVDLAIPRGQVVLVCGVSGGGKTTLTRLVNGLVPWFFDGDLSGEVLVDGHRVDHQSVQKTAETVGSVFQNPKSQFFNRDSTDEVVFGCENMGVPVDEIALRVAAAERDFGLAPLLGRDLFCLSGGERQKIACASASLPAAPIMVLDEPTSNLDGAAIHQLADVIALWKRQGKTVLVADHRTGYLRGIADRAIILDAGRVVDDMAAEEFWALPDDELRRRGLRSHRPITFADAMSAPGGGEAIALRNLACTRAKVRTLDIPCLDLPVGEVIGIVGTNGAGKTTFARCLCGLERRNAGKVSLRGARLSRRARLSSSFLVMQDVNHQLFTESVDEEVMLGMRGDVRAQREEADRILALLNLSDVKERHPLSLSGGQKQRVAIASALATRRNVIVLDEPTSGLDWIHMQHVATCARQLAQAGATVLIITHDPELICACCSYTVLLEQGRVACAGGWDVQTRARISAFFNPRGEEGSARA